MTVRGGKNRILLYVAGAFTLAVIVLLYHNAAQRLEDVGKSYERCHMNEESLSAQLQVILEYKVRLEKSLQQEKSDHAQTKEELQNKVEEEKQQRERENIENINKFTALQQQYKLLKSQHEDVSQEFKKARQEQLTELEERSRIETHMNSLKQEVKHLKAEQSNELHLLQVKYDTLDRENEKLKAEREVLGDKEGSHVEELLLEKDRLKKELAQCRATNPVKTTPSRAKSKEEPLVVGNADKSLRSSTAANKQDGDVLASGNNMYVNTSTPMINPDAIQSQDRGNALPPANVLPMPQPRPETSSRKEAEVQIKPEMAFEAKESVGVLPVPGFGNQFDHVPAVASYRDRLRAAEHNMKLQHVEGEVGDEGEPIVRRAGGGASEEGGAGAVPAGEPREIPRNQLYHYQEQYDNKDVHKEEEDDDVDQIDYNNNNNNNNNVNAEDADKKHEMHRLVKVPFADKHDSVMVNPK